MHISEFSRRASLSVDTVRYYVRAGLLSPGQGTKGGRNPYQVFSEADIRIADAIRFCQALGMSLKQISALQQAGKDTQLSFLQEKRDALRDRGRELLRLSQSLDDKITWIDAGSHGEPSELRHPDLKILSSEDCGRH